MVSKCRRCIFGCFDALPRNIIGWIKIHQLILQKEMPDNFQHFKYLSKIFFSHLPWWSSGRVPSPLSEGLWFKSPLNFHGSWHITLIKIAKYSKTTFAYRSTFYLFYAWGTLAWNSWSTPSPLPLMNTAGKSVSLTNCLCLWCSIDTCWALKYNH